jgi:formylglycine-generating enzyme required for sulfatase activity
VGGSVRRRFSAAAASIIVLGTSLLAGSCTNPLNWTLRKWSAMYDDMAYVDGGTLTLGDTRVVGWGNETPIHPVSISPFLISRFEVTQGLYEEIMGINPSYFQPATDPILYPYDANLPVERVTWLDAVKFCNQFSEAMGLQPCYLIDESVPGSETVTCDFTADGYRLPTEAEWEYAARGSSLYSTDLLYAGSDVADDVAWYESNSDSKTHPVGELAPNELGLYDMSGNVWEYVWDGTLFSGGDYSFFYDAPYNWDGASPIPDPHGPFVGNNDKVWLANNFITRGGGWWEYGSWMGDLERVSARTSFFDAATALYIDTGFRVVRSQQ